MMATQCTAKDARSPAPYKSDADMSESEIIQGFMEMSSFSLPDDEPHKYSRSKSCMKI